MSLSQTPDTPVLLHHSQINAASQLLGRAFQNDPYMLYAIPHASQRVRVLPSLFRIVLRYSLRYGTIYATPDLAGVACCLPPGQTRPALRRLILVSLRGIPRRLGLAGLRRYLHVSHYTDKAHAETAPGAHWYLWVLGVESAQQGHGIGGHLLQTVLQRARTDNLPCYLETENARNVPFYQRHGFRLVSEAIVENTEVHVYAMLWEPEQAQSPLPGEPRSALDARSRTVLCCKGGTRWGVPRLGQALIAAPEARQLFMGGEVRVNLAVVEEEDLLWAF